MLGQWRPAKIRKSHCCVPLAATFSKRRKIGASWSERCDAYWEGSSPWLRSLLCTPIALLDFNNHCKPWSNFHIIKNSFWAWSLLTSSVHSCYLGQQLFRFTRMLVGARKRPTSWEISLWMTPSEAPKALQTSECNELLDPTRASCWIFAQH